MERRVGATLVSSGSLMVSRAHGEREAPGPISRSRERMGLEPSDGLWYLTRPYDREGDPRELTSAPPKQHWQPETRLDPLGAGQEAPCS